MYYLGEKVESSSIILKDIYRKFFPSLCLFADRILKDTDESKDVVQEVFIKLLNSKAKFENETALKAYLYILTKNACLDHLKKSKNLQSLNAEAFAYTEKQFLDDLVREETFRLLDLALKELGPQSQKIIELSMCRLSNKEISDELDISLNTVKTLKLRAYKRLRTLLGSQVMALILNHFFPLQ